MAKRSRDFKLDWINLKGISLASAARESGFDLAVYHGYREGTQEELRKRTVNAALEAINDAYEYKTEEKFGAAKDLADVSCGVYVIRLSNPFTIRYRSPESGVDDGDTVDFEGTSQIVYIGKGDVKGRLKQHLGKKLFDFMLSLSGANFDFQIVEPTCQHHSPLDHHTQLEHDLLKEFANTVSQKERGFPLLNKNSGTDLGKADIGSNWNYPLRRDVLNLEWAIEPTEKWRKVNLDT